MGTGGQAEAQHPSKHQSVQNSLFLTFLLLFLFLCAIYSSQSRERRRLSCSADQFQLIARFLSMILKNLMEDKQLDLNRPFRSVRRLPIAPPPKTDNSLPRIPSPPVYKSELKSGPIRNPGTVPFVWEQSPGRPKDESKSQPRSLQQPPVAPKLPPGRILNVKQQSSDKGSESTSFSQSQAGGDIVMKHDSSKRESEDKGSSDSEGDYMDARDILSRTESSLLNCSVSGLSGLDGPYGKPFGTFSDPQTQDFMMGRFLPAAKAMASESPHHNTRKQPVPRELPPRQVNRPANAQHYDVQGREAGEDSEDSSDDEPGYSSSPKVCGLIPQFCLLSPVPCLRMQGHVPFSSVPRAQDKPMAFRSNCEKQDGSSLYRRLQGNGTSPNQYETSQSPLHEEKEDTRIPGNIKNSRVRNDVNLNPHGKSRRNLREMLACKSNEWELGSASPVVEKTLYIDSVHVAKSRDSDSSHSDTIRDHRGNDFEILEKEREKEETYSVDSSLHDIKQLDVVQEKGMSQPKNLVSVDSSILSSSGRSSHDMKTDKTDDFRQDQDLVQVSTTLMSSKMAEDQRFDSENQQPTTEPTISDTTSHGNSSILPLPPPLPKSPSESWLSRVLTAASSRNHRSSLGFHNYNRTQASKTPSLDPKWETIVKTSNTHHGHLRFSEELLAPIPEV